MKNQLSKIPKRVVLSYSGTFLLMLSKGMGFGGSGSGPGSGFPLANKTIKTIRPITSMKMKIPMIHFLRLDFQGGPAPISGSC